MAYSGTSICPLSTTWAGPRAIPEETPSPSKMRSAAVPRRRRTPILRSAFIEAALDQEREGIECRLGLLAARLQLDVAARPGSQHHQTHDGCAGDGGLAFR